MLLSIFSGIDLFGRAFTEQGYNVVTAPDLILGLDIRDFHCEPNVFEGLLITPPCQEFSKLKRTPDTELGLEMIEHSKRLIKESDPQWFIIENVAGVPDIKVEGYSWQRIDVNQGWYEETSRLRVFQFGSKKGLFLDIPRQPMKDIKNGCALASDNRSFIELVAIQGLPSGFDLPSFNVEGKKRAVGNGVPLSLGRVVAKEIKRVTEAKLEAREVIISEMKQNRCKCECGRIVYGRKQYFDNTCRKRASRKRIKA